MAESPRCDGGLRTLGRVAQEAGDAGKRVCGDCALCCVVLRVDELGKPGGTHCPALHPAFRGGGRSGGDPLPGGCSIHATRPPICRAYRCAWLQGRFRDDDRPDRLGALVDFAPRGASSELRIIEAVPGAYERSPRLQELASAWRELLPVRISDVADTGDPDRPVRVLLAGGEEHRVRGEHSAVFRDGVPAGERRLPWLERGARRLLLALRRLRMRRY